MGKTAEKVWPSKSVPEEARRAEVADDDGWTKVIKIESVTIQQRRNGTQASLSEKEIRTTESHKVLVAQAKGSKETFCSPDTNSRKGLADMNNA